jgi:hypothetical protein
VLSDRSGQVQESAMNQGGLSFGHTYCGAQTLGVERPDGVFSRNEAPPSTSAPPPPTAATSSSPGAGRIHPFEDATYFGQVADIPDDRGGTEGIEGIEVKRQ